MLAIDTGYTLDELLHGIALIERVGVLPEYQNKGVWKKLVRYSIADVKESRVNIIVGAIEVRNDIGLHSFTQAGWTIVRKEKDYKGKQYYLIYLKINEGFP